MASKPTYFVIGAHKAGTTNFCNMLGQHPDVFMTRPKEPAYFTASYDKGLDWYEALFARADGEKALGEGSTTYSQLEVYPEAADRIAAYAPDARIIYLVRHPLDRIVSGWMERKAAGRVQVPDSLLESVQTVPGLVDASRYVTQLDAYRRHFPEDRIKVLFFEDLIADPASVMTDAYDFLEVDPAFEATQDDQARNTTTSKRSPGALLQSAGRVSMGKNRSVLKRLRRSRVGDWLARGTARRVLDSAFTSAIEKPRWTDESHAWALAALGDEPAELLSTMGKPADFWDLSR